MNRIRSIAAYLKERLGEHSTWIGVAGALVAAGAAAAPWCYVGAVVGVVGVLLPDRGKS